MTIDLHRRLSYVGIVLFALVGLSVVEVGQVVFTGIANGNRADRPLLLMFWGCFSWWLSAALLLPIVQHLGHRYPLHRLHLWQTASIHICASLCFSIAHLIGAHTIRAVFYNDKPFAVHIPYLINYYYIYGVFFYWGALGCFFAADYNAQARSASLTASRLENSLSQAQLQVLRSRLNPHFLFNAMQAISGLALAGEQEQVVEMLGRLSQLLRRSIDELSDTEVRLSTELDFLNDYIAIQSLRFPQRLTFVPSIAPDTLHALVPPLVLQPLVENAVEHGIAASSGAGCVSLTTRREGDFLQVEIRDTGPGFHCADRQRRTGTGVGLDCTRQRLQHLYGANHRLECHDLPERGACVIVSIPFHGELPLRRTV